MCAARIGYVAMHGATRAHTGIYYQKMWSREFDLSLKYFGDECLGIVN